MWKKFDVISTQIGWLFLIAMLVIQVLTNPHALGRSLPLVIIVLIEIVLGWKLDIFGGKLWIFRKFKSTVVQDLYVSVALVVYTFMAPSLVAANFTRIFLHQQQSVTGTTMMFVSLFILFLIVSLPFAKFVSEKINSVSSGIMGLVWGVAFSFDVLRVPDVLSAAGTIKYPNSLFNGIVEQETFAILIAVYVAIIVFKQYNLQFGRLFTNFYINWQAAIAIVIVYLLGMLANNWGMFHIYFSWSKVLFGIEPGAFEEIADRGIILLLSLVMLQRSRREYLPRAIAIAGVTFGLTHFGNFLGGQNLGGTIGQVLMATGMGVFLLVVLLITRNLIVPMILHAIWDITVALTTNGSPTAVITKFDMSDFVTSVVAGLVMLVGSVILYRLFQAQINEFVKDYYTPALTGHADD